MGILKIINENLELIGTINDLGVKNDEVEDFLVNPKLFNLGKEIGLEQNDLYEIFLNAISFKKYNSTYILSDKAIEEFKKDKSIESLSKKLETILYDINTPKIDLHPLIDINSYNMYDGYMFVNKKNVRFLQDSGYTINRKDIGNNIYEDFSNIKQNEYYFVVGENKQIYFSISKPKGVSYYPLDNFNNTLKIEILNNFIKYTEKQFDFKWDEEKVKSFKTILDYVMRDSAKDRNMNFYTYDFINHIRNGIESLGYSNYKENEEQKNRNTYIKNFIEKPFNELFNSFYNSNINDILFNKDIEIKTKELDSLNLKCSNYNENLLKQLENIGYFLNYSESKTKTNYANYITLSEEKNPISGENTQVIYCYNKLKDVPYKYQFVKNEQIENKINELNNDKKTLNEQSLIIENMETKLEENKITLESFISEYKIEKGTKQYNDLMNIFNEKQEPLIQEIEKEKTMFEKIKEKTKEFLGYERS